MKHALRKYIAPCGSALFMVVSTMAALVVLVTAMYMSVVSSGRVQIASFNQEQAYVASTSIADNLKGYLNNGVSAAMQSKLLDLNVGDKMSTNGNDFASLVEGGTREDSELGAYTVTITRLKDEKQGDSTMAIYDVAVTASTNGVVETTHLYLMTQKETTTPPSMITRFFTATGYIPNDVVVGDGVYTSEMYFDSEYTVFSDIKGESNSDLTLKGSIICAGSAVFSRGKTTVQCQDTQAWYIGKNLTFKNTQPTSIDLKGKGGNANDIKNEPEHGLIVVGGDLTMTTLNWPNIGNNGKFTDVYVLGDAYIAKTNFHGNLYVNGDVYFMSSDDNKVEGYLYLNGECKNYPGKSGGHFTSSTKIVKWSGWTATGDCQRAPAKTPADVGKLLTSKIGGSTYLKWQIDMSGFIMEDENTPKKENITFYNGNEDVANNKYVHYIDKDCVIGEIKSKGNHVSSLAIVIDTGNKGDTRTIQLSNNDGSEFSWCPSTVEHARMNIVTIGDGTLVVDVPEGVRYQSTHQEFFGHIGWYYLLGGKVTTTDAGTHDYFDRSGLQYVNKSYIEGVLKETIHETYFDGSKNSCTTCKYTETTVDGKTVYKCTNPDHYDTYSTKPETCVCAGYVDTGSVTAYAASHGIDMTYEGKSQMPNVNIWVESCSESADIQFGVGSDGKGLQNNLFFGYVYAPYMTYVDLSCGENTGGGVRMVGGLIVSDYVISGYYEFVYARPSMSVDSIGITTGDPLRPTGSREWRHYGV